MVVRGRRRIAYGVAEDSIDPTEGMVSSREVSAEPEGSKWCTYTAGISS